MKRSLRVIAYDLHVNGEVVKAGTPIEQLQGRKWFTPAWLNDAQRCGHVVKQISDDAPQGKPTPDTLAKIAPDPLAGTKRLGDGQPEPEKPEKPQNAKPGVSEAPPPEGASKKSGKSSK